MQPITDIQVTPPTATNAASTAPTAAGTPPAAPQNTAAPSLESITNHLLKPMAFASGLSSRWCDSPADPCNGGSQ